MQLQQPRRASRRPNRRKSCRDVSPKRVECSKESEIHSVVSRRETHTKPQKAVTTPVSERLRRQQRCCRCCGDTGRSARPWGPRSGAPALGRLSARFPWDEGRSERAPNTVPLGIHPRGKETHSRNNVHGNVLGGFRQPPRRALVVSSDTWLLVDVLEDCLAIESTLATQTGVFRKLCRVENNPKVTTL